VIEHAVVIGSGPNGLAAAIALASAGRAVTVLEAADEPGGAVRTEELTLPGFLHDTFSSVYPATAASPVFSSMPLDRFGLEWVHPEACSAQPLPDGRALALYRDLGRTAEELNVAQPGDGDAWRAFVEPLLDAFDAVRATMMSGFPPLTGPVKLLQSAGPAGLARFVALVPGSAERLGRRLFENADARAWLYGAAGHGDVPPTGPGSAIAVAYLNLLGHAVGWPSPRGGAQALTDALVGYLVELGGRVRTGVLVTAVEAAHGRVTGVRLADGERVAADTVIADVMPHALLALAGEHLGSVYRRLLGRYTYGPATVKVDWALDGPIPWTSWSRRSRRRRAACPSGRFYCSGSRRSPTRRARRRAGTPPGRTPTAPGTVSTGRARSTGTWSAWRRRWSGTHPGSATGSWPGTCSDRPRSRNATATWSAVMWAAAATGSTR
jgi:phytoene dehydrogenase-like protein